MPLFLMVLFGIIDYGWYFYQRYALVAAIRDGVRYGATISSASAASAAKTRAITDLSVAGSPIDPSGITWGPGANAGATSGTAPTAILTMSASFPFKAFVGYVPLPSLVTYQMTMLLEIQP
jgi:Flp pilus assembly protein TadG